MLSQPNIELEIPSTPNPGVILPISYGETYYNSNNIYLSPASPTSTGTIFLRGGYVYEIDYNFNFNSNLPNNNVDILLSLVNTSSPTTLIMSAGLSIRNTGSMYNIRLFGVIDLRSLNPSLYNTYNIVLNNEIDIDYILTINTHNLHNSLRITKLSNTNLQYTPYTLYSIYP